MVPIYEVRGGAGGGVHGVCVISFCSGAASASERGRPVEHTRQKNKQKRREHHHQTADRPFRSPRASDSGAQKLSFCVPRALFRAPRWNFGAPRRNCCLLGTVLWCFGNCIMVFWELFCGVLGIVLWNLPCLRGIFNKLMTFLSFWHVFDGNNGGWN